ncbi:hypothetical protein NLG97_g10865 [Lecanicillium saksenae]|uniref:Uncharacterized protein n=1 Tax=Lecanicillium saksenae TaxID=468837 RepID=A0ACC1QDT3_9HYPO|nr:hypothetical protein NLG97_g10865 [Lecanicillium saksenae]
MGGFQLGSTIVLVFEAPTTTTEGGEKKGWEWKVDKDQTIKMGQALGRVNAELVDGENQGRRGLVITWLFWKT